MNLCLNVAASGCIASLADTTVQFLKDSQVSVVFDSMKAENCLFNGDMPREFSVTRLKKNHFFMPGREALLTVSECSAAISIALTVKTGLHHKHCAIPMP